MRGLIRNWKSEAAPAALDFATQVGLAYQLFCGSGISQSCAWLVSTYVFPAVSVRQIAFSFDQTGAPEALASWAFVSDEIAERLTVQPRKFLHLSEWNEGLNLWVMLLLGKPGRTAPLLRRLLNTELRHVARVRGHRFDVEARPTEFVDRCRRGAVSRAI